MLFLEAAKDIRYRAGLAIVTHLQAKVNFSWGDLAFVPNHSSNQITTVEPSRSYGPPMSSLWVLHREKSKFFWKYLGDFSISRAELKFQQLLDQILLQTVTKRSGQQNNITLTSKNQIH